MYGVWQTARHFSEPGLQPWGVSVSLSKLAAWAVGSVPSSGQKRLFFAKHTGPGSNWADENWVVVGLLFKDGIRVNRKDPERYEKHRRAEVSPWKNDGRYPEPTRDDWERTTVNIDAEGGQPHDGQHAEEGH
ncbi:hypothetical protein MJO55_21565 [Mycolicibacterium rufum]|uniref:Uncharacterized protein n=1 Tax=Mycolicibacterium rufum TaxID=318424 RepID=A0A9X3BJ33_9MYCO|nr:hypothetical protein [Mycolicibacterium rufum]KGI69586.1 hypothetical protein EU78_21505 [Mycolicibacterium rufum]MCV7072654.1 hypothetical protein [Mycolicibacterium rufum]ULP35815.1 hypothetical protein MJO55_21565 [Mycolicibacterium rufum]